jgi:MoxR-like ATPase
MSTGTNPTSGHAPVTESDLAAVRELQAAADKVFGQIENVIVGQKDVLNELMIALLAGGHCILEGVPGLAKTLMISTLSESMSLSFSRIQFTPDLMPSDITGTEVIQEDKSTGNREFKFLRGPVFANVILADEINRTPPKTQAALLEAMQEKQVTVGGDRHPLAPPFFVLATQNPIEQEGTYPLPEAQQDRFMFKVFVRYPSYEEELVIAEQTTTHMHHRVEPVLGAEQIIRLQDLVRRIPAAPNVIKYALEITRKTRPEEDGAPEFIKRMVTWGAGPRAVQFMVLGAKARAALQGRHCASTDDVKAIAHPVLRHRIVTNFSAEADGYTPDRIIKELLAATPANPSAITSDERLNTAVSA